MLKKILFLLIFLAATSAAILAQSNQHYNVSKNELALKGYDPVSYFRQPTPAKGNKKWSYEYNGVTYWFENEVNKKEFVKNPTQYEPAYGGWCALAIAKNGEKVSVDPLTYKISQGRLLLFYKTAFYNALTVWNKEKAPEAELLQKGDQNWQNIIK